MIRKITESIVANELGEVKKILHLSSHIEKIETIYSFNETPPDMNTSLVFESSESEKILKITGNKNKAYYSRTIVHNLAGTSFTFDGNNAIPTKIYVHNYLRIKTKTSEKTRVSKQSMFITS
jgi:hypothetical protein